MSMTTTRNVTLALGLVWELMTVPDALGETN